MIKFFKIIAILEGISYLLLFGNMFITKNINFDLYKTILGPLGMTHGALFIAYLILALLVKIKVNWSAKIFLIVCVASLIPFATFYIEKKYLENIK
jgi:integral membrane protein